MGKCDKSDCSNNDKIKTDKSLPLQDATKSKTSLISQSYATRLKSIVIRPVPLPVTDLSIRQQTANLNWPYPDLSKAQTLWKIKSTFTVLAVGLWARCLMTIMNKTKILNKERLIQSIFNRPQGVPLITVSNHESCIDDPCLIGALMSAKQLSDQKNMRWGLGAHDICYQNKLNSKIFSLGKVMPTVRGYGVYQKAVDFSIERLNVGDWVHIFPEGRVNMEREGMYRLKWGIGRMISEAKINPIIIPFWHTGMADVHPPYPPYIPKWGKQVLVNVGEAIELGPIFKNTNYINGTNIEKRLLITNYIQDKLLILREETLKISEQLFSKR